jgi:GH24 family phage-related lysozyme (muramidase)
MVDVSVVFGGDIRGLSSQTDAAKRSIQDAAKQISSSFDATNPAVERLQDSIDKLNASTERAASSAETLKSYANWAFALGAVKIAYSAVTGTIGLATGAVVLSGQAVVATGGLLVTGVRAWQSYAESMAYVAQYAPFVEMANYKTLASINILGHAIDNVTSFYGQMSLGIKDWLKSADIYKSGLLESAGVSIAAAGAMERFNKVSHEAGFENPTRALQAFTTQLTHIPGMTDQVAASIAASFAKIPTLTGPMNQFIVELTQKMSSSEDSAKNFAASLTNAMTDPASAGLNFLNTLGNIDGSLKEQFLTAQRQTDVGKMQASILDAMIQKYRQLAEDRTRGLREELEATGKIGIVGTTLQRSLQAQITEANEYNRLLEKQFAVLSNQANTLRSMVPTSEELSASMSGIVTAFNPLTNQLESVNAKMRVFNSTLKDSTGDAASLIAHFEAGAQGPALKAYFDKSDSGKKDAYAIGYGSHKMPDGSDVKPGDSITKEEAEQLLKDRTAEFAAIAAGQIGSTWNDLSTKVKASLTDLAYNYGSVPSSVVAAARSRDESGIADAIRSLKSDSKGNRRRRSEEADNIDKRELGGTPAEIETKRHVHDEQVRINQAIAGGNEIEKANLATLEKQISGKKDDVTAQKEVVAAIQRQLDLTESTNTRYLFKIS